jgi:hypothetical protein
MSPSPQTPQTRYSRGSLSVGSSLAQSGVAQIALSRGCPFQVSTKGTAFPWVPASPATPYPPPPSFNPLCPPINQHPQFSAPSSPRSPLHLSRGDTCPAPPYSFRGSLPSGTPFRSVLPLLGTPLRVPLPSALRRAPQESRRDAPRSTLPQFAVLTLLRSGLRHPPKRDLTPTPIGAFGVSVPDLPDIAVVTPHPCLSGLRGSPKAQS